MPRFINLCMLFCLVQFSAFAHALDQVTLQLKWFHQFQFAGYYAAIEKGFYADEGLEVTLRENNPEEDRIGSVVDGRAEYGISDTGLMLARQQGVPVVLLAQIFQHSPLVLITKQSSGIRTPYDLIGRSVQVDSIGISQVPILAMLSETLGSIDKVNLQPFRYRYDDLVTEQVAAIPGYSTDQPFNYAQNGIAVNTLDPRDYGIDFYGDNLFTSEKELLDNPDRVIRMTRASLKGWAYALDHPDEIIDLIIEKYNTQNFTRQQLEYEARETSKLILADFIQLGMYRPSRFSKISQTYASLGLSGVYSVPKKLMLHEWVDELSLNQTDLRIIQQLNGEPSNEALVQAPRIALTTQETEWLAANPIVRVATDPSWAPIEFKSSSGLTEGISIDYLEKLSELIDIEFEIVDVQSWSQAVSLMTTRQADMFSSVARTPEREAYTIFTRPYVSMPIGIYTRNDVSYVGSIVNLKGKQVAVPEGYAIQEWLENDFPDLDLVAVEGPSQGMELVSEGKVDAFVGNIVTANYYIGKLQLTNVRFAGDTPYANSQSMAVRSDWPILASIVQKGLDAIPVIERESIFNRWMSIRFERDIDYSLVIIVALIAFTLVIFVAVWNRMLKRRVLIRTQHLHESESRFRSFFERNSSVMFLTEPNTGSIVSANKAAEDFYGYNTDQFQSMNIDELSPLSSDEVAIERRQATEEKRNYFNVTHRLADGSERYVEVYSSPIQSAGQRLLFSIVHDITDRKLAEERIYHQANYDALTEIPNRFLVMDRLKHLIAEAARNNTKVGVLFLDLDDFKKVNDTMGHEAGDRLLVEFGRRLSECIREGDTLGRLGGDEFLMLVGDLKSTHDVGLVAQKLLSTVKAPIPIDGRELILTSSIGIAIYPEDGKSSVELMRKADSAMYHSKEHGRNTYSFFTESMNHNVSRRLAIEQQLHGAIERQEFYLNYQPKYDVATKRIIGAEALLRWNNLELGEIRPDEFIPIAEQTGLIVAIGEFVLSQSAQFLSDLHQKGWRELSMAINLSPRQFREDNLVKVVGKILSDAGVGWSSIEFEITEGVLMTGLKHTSLILDELSRAGASLAMDDFGTGYSSLSYIRSYPFNVLKIDRSFIMDITEDRKDLELVSAAILMSRSLGLKVVAEGVESQAQLDILADLGCDIAQGYLLSKPVCEQAFIDLLESNDCTN